MSFGKGMLLLFRWRGVSIIEILNFAGCRLMDRRISSGCLRSGSAYKDFGNRSVRSADHLVCHKSHGGTFSVVQATLLMTEYDRGLLAALNNSLPSLKKQFYITPVCPTSNGTWDTAYQSLAVHSPCVDFVQPVPNYGTDGRKLRHACEQCEG